MIAELDRILSHGLTAVQARAILGLYASQGDARLAPRMSTIAQWCHITTAAATSPPQPPQPTRPPQHLP